MTPIRLRPAFGVLVVLSLSTFVVWHGGTARANLGGTGYGLVARQALPGRAGLDPMPGPSGAFKISGSVAGLYPGLTTPLTLTVTNSEHFAIVVTSLTVSVGDAKRGCSAANITVSPFTGTLDVPAQGSAHATLEISLLHEAPDACQGAVFPLRYDGLAVKR